MELFLIIGATLLFAGAVVAFLLHRRRQRFYREFLQARKPVPVIDVQLHVDTLTFQKALRETREQMNQLTGVKQIAR